MIIDSLDKLTEVLYHRLGYSLRSQETIQDIPEGIPTDIHKVLWPFLQNFQGRESLMNVRVTLAYKEIFDFLPLGLDLGKRVQGYLSALGEHFGNQQIKALREKAKPVPYFMSRAYSLPGFKLLSLPARDLIIAEGAVAIPPLLIACTFIPDGTKHLTLTPESILSATDLYRKKNGGVLAEVTQAKYKRMLVKLLAAIREVYKILGYGSSLFFFQGEDEELIQEDKQRLRFFSKLKSTPFYSSSYVLRPHILKRFLLSRGSYEIEL